MEKSSRYSRARQVGKTTLVRQFAKEFTEMNYPAAS
jgi:GTPase SAR1 family protein